MTPLATSLTWSVVSPIDCTDPPSFDLNYCEALTDLPAITIVDDYWLRGQLLSQQAGSVQQQLLDVAVQSKLGWNTVTLGAAAYAASQLRTAGDPPSENGLTQWISNVKNGVVARIVNTMGASWVNVAEDHAFSSNASFAGISTVITGLIPIPVLSAVAGLVLGMWGASQNSGIPSEYTQVVGFANESESMSDLFCLESLLRAGEIHLAGSTVQNTPANVRAVWEAYVGPNSGDPYRVAVLFTPGGTPQPVSLQDLPLGVPSFLATSP